MGDGVTFYTEPLAETIEFVGPMRLRLHVSSSTKDMDIFATVRAFDPDGKELTFFGATEPKAPVSQGWLRVSQRKIDPTRSTDYRPYHVHNESEWLTPGEIYPVDVEIWPASLHLPAGYRLALTVQGVDFQRPDATGDQRGSGWFLHNDPDDRPASTFGGSSTIHTGPGRESFLYLPVINAQSSQTAFERES
jgi:predicted acyl esterase